MRVLLRVLSPVLGLAVAAAGALLAVEVIAAWIGGPGYPGLLVPWPTWLAVLTDLTWRGVPMLATCAVLAALGLVLVLIAATAGRRDIRLDDPAAEVSVTTTPRVLARLVGQQVRADEKVSSASVTASARSVRVVAVGHGDHGGGDPGGGMRQSVRDRADSVLGELPLARRPRLSVAVRSNGGPR